MSDSQIIIVVILSDRDHHILNITKVRYELKTVANQRKALYSRIYTNSYTDL